MHKNTTQIEGAIAGAKLSQSIYWQNQSCNCCVICVSDSRSPFALGRVRGQSASPSSERCFLLMLVPSIWGKRWKWSSSESFFQKDSFRQCLTWPDTSFWPIPSLSAGLFGKNLDFRRTLVTRMSAWILRAHPIYPASCQERCSWHLGVHSTCIH